MKNNYKRIGDYIRLVDERNVDLKVTKLLGLTVNKVFIPSVANTVGTNMKKYKIISKNQFACSLMQVRRDKKIPVALLKDFENAIISQAYPVFEIINQNELLPDYLMMWMSRKEFDREACFYAVGGVRGSLEWEDFCDMKLPVPSIEKQKEIVKEYNVIVNRIKLNEKLNEKLEETAQAVFKEWFVDFNFPMTKEQAQKLGKPEIEGKPYKDNGGKLVWNEVLEKDVPEGWTISNLSSIANYLNGLAMQKFETNSSIFLPVVKIRELNQGFTDINSGKAKLDIPRNYIVNNGDIIFSWSASLKIDLWCGGVGALNQHLFKVTSKKYKKWFIYFWTKYHLNEFIRIADGNKTSMGHIKREHLDNAKVLIPLELELNKMNKLKNKFLDEIILLKIEKLKLIDLKNILLSKMVRGE